MTDRIPASIEVAPKQAIESEALPGLFPSGTSVYITDIGTDTIADHVAAARRVRDLGYEPVPHFASRRLTARDQLEERVARLSAEAGVRDVLVIGGGLPREAGDFASTMHVLETGVFDRNAIRRIGVAGHPEGSPDFGEEAAIQALRLKQAFAERTGADLRIVTQFGFAPDTFIEWAKSLKSNGIDLPVHLGVAGPATLKTLLRFAALCGVGNSIAFLKHHALKVTALAGTQSPETVVEPIEAFWRANPDGPIAQIHAFPFGGIAKTSDWLFERGSWLHEQAMRTAAE